MARPEEAQEGDEALKRAEAGAEGKGALVRPGGLAGAATMRQHVPEQPDANSPAAMPPADTPDSTPALRIAEQALAMIREQIDRERDRADKAEAEVVRLGASIAEAKTALGAALGRIEATEAARNRAEAARDRSVQQVAEAESVLLLEKQARIAAEGEAAVLRGTEQVRRAQSLWPRLKAAWRGQ